MMYENLLGVQSSFDKTLAYDCALLDEVALKDYLDPANIKTKIIYDSYLIEEPLLTLLENNNDLLNANLIQTRFLERWSRKPAYTSIEYYGTPAYAYIIMFVNNISSRRDFVVNNFLYRSVLIPTRQIIESLSLQAQGIQAIETPTITKSELYNVPFIAGA